MIKRVANMLSKGKQFAKNEPSGTDLSGRWD